MKKITLLLFGIITSLVMTSQIPLLNSNSSAIHKVLYLDFDGEVVVGTAWNTSVGVPTINALPSTLSQASMIQIWQRVSEDYRPFDVNVTTDVAKFNAANPNLRMRIVITPSSAWYPNNVGGVAYLNSFSWGGNPDTPCWVFENKLGYSAKNCAEAASHEGGHTVSLKHQSTYDASCVKTAEYNPGLGSGMTSWAPIMGVGYSKNVTIWHNGPNSTTCTTLQYDHGSNGITGALFLNYRTDDVGDTYATSKFLNMNSATVIDSGLIANNIDVDVYRFDLCNPRYVTVDVKPWALDTTNYSGANLDVRLTLYNAATSNSIAIDTPLTILNARIGANLAAGSYYFVIDGGGSANYSDYGSMGKYYVKVTSNNVPAIVSSFNAILPYCTGQPIMFADNSSGSPNAWTWTLTGASPATSTLSNFMATYNSPGIYTISLSASNSTLSSCGTTQTIQIAASPSISVISSANTICANQTVTLTASGASTYTWSNNSYSNSIIVNPQSTAIYSVSGQSQGCNDSKTISINVNSLPNLNAGATKSLICLGDSTYLSVTGANTYTWSNAANGSTISVSPSITTVYSVSGTDANGCINTTTVQLVVSWCTFIKENDSHSEFSIYPNPTEAELEINSSDCEGCTLRIYNTIGQLVKTATLKKGVTKLDLGNYSSGIYHITIYKEDQKVYSGKLVKH